MPNCKVLFDYSHIWPLYRLRRGGWMATEFTRPQNTLFMGCNAAYILQT